jgi:hypothetical protein
VLATAACSVVAPERLSHPLGEVELLPTSTGVLVAAPHGTHDASTAEVAVEAARRLGAGYVVARRFAADGTRINVNRPTEGASRRCPEESRTPRAGEVYALYTRAVSTAAMGRPLRLYVEVHGNSNPQTATRVEVATTGLSADEARRMRDTYPAILARTREHAPAYPGLALLVEPLDRIVYTASCAKSIGLFSTDLVPRVVHLELPRSAREREMIEATALLIAGIVRGLLSDTPARSSRLRE